VSRTDRTGVGNVRRLIHPTLLRGLSPYGSIMSMKRDTRLEKVDRIRIDWDTFKKALERNYLSPEYEYQRQDKTYVLRLYPPFESEMDAEYYVSEQGVHYNSDWDEKPFHMKPELFVLEGTDKGFRGIVNYDTETDVRNALTDEQIEEEGGIEQSLQIAHEIFWDELKSIRPDEIDLGHFTPGPSGYTVEIDWIDD